MRLTYSEHADEKIRTRRISRGSIRLVLEDPDQRFYDVPSNANVALKEVIFIGRRLWLVVVFTISQEGAHIVTVYPVKDIQTEIRRKVNSGRWIRLKR